MRDLIFNARSDARSSRRSVAEGFISILKQQLVEMDIGSNDGQRADRCGK
ncbi:hypothetical protein Q3C01_39840 [Bradyrhizobium sp. UFLA05-109]